MATTDGIAGEMVWGLMVAAVEARSGRELPIQPIEWLVEALQVIESKIDALRQLIET